MAGGTDVDVGSRRQLSTGRLGKSVGFLSFDDLRRVDAALRIVLDL